jgi:Protein of unknown function (DUF3047)
MVNPRAARAATAGAEEEAAMIWRISRHGLRAGGAVALVALWLNAGIGPVRAQDDCVVLEDFATAPAGQFPPGWRARKDEGKAVYMVRDEAGTRFLHAAAKGLGIQAAREVTWDLNAYPILAWSWRPGEFPKEGDERQSGTNDSALAVYMLVDYSRLRGPKAVKYIWSERVPVGTHLTSNMGLTQVRVLRSGAPADRQWIEERVNVREDFKKYFSESETPKPAGIAVLTDSDDTKSSAQGDYRAFRACRG